MSGIIGLLPCGKMARGIAAICRRGLEIVIVVNVASRTGHVGMAVREQESGGVVIEDGGGPGNGVVAGRTGCGGKGRAGGGMGRIIGLLPLGQVAVLASAGCEVVVVADVAGGADEIGVAVGERKTGCGVIELGAKPAIESVALLAFAGGERGADTRVIRVSRVLPIFQMARIALRFEAEELPNCCALMAGIAGDGGMRAEKRKAILVV